MTLASREYQPDLVLSETEGLIDRNWHNRPEMRNPADPTYFLRAWADEVKRVYGGREPFERYNYLAQGSFHPR